MRSAALSVSACTRATATAASTAARSRDLTIDHIVPLALAVNRAYDDKDVATRCRRCNARKGHLPPRQELRGLRRPGMGMNRRCSDRASTEAAASRCLLDQTRLRRRATESAARTFAAGRRRRRRENSMYIGVGSVLALVLLILLLVWIF